MLPETNPPVGTLPELTHLGINVNIPSKQEAGKVMATCRWAQNLAGIDFVPAIGFHGTASEQASSPEVRQGLHQAWHEQRIPAFVECFLSAKRADNALG